MREMPVWFRLDRTKGQEHALYVAAEKDTLRQQLTGWLEFAGIPVLFVRGFSSQSYADVVRDRVAHEQREAHLAVVGDFDCSGEDIERDWMERTGCWSSVTWVLLTYDQMRAYGLACDRGQARRPEVAGLRPPLRRADPAPACMTAHRRRCVGLLHELGVIGGAHRAATRHRNRQLSRGLLAVFGVHMKCSGTSHRSEPIPSLGVVINCAVI
ncbi:hypothetical protein ACIGQE_27895 [Streptomyces sp. NPDC053429]|uniref:hypothetical protein n=1 Tax=Streptomyces sp. NPDC053429 TaxID=3365702 RepID=UPI0037D18187